MRYSVAYLPMWELVVPAWKWLITLHHSVFGKIMTAGCWALDKIGLRGTNFLDDFYSALLKIWLHNIS